jgi:hypothetical protein
MASFADIGRIILEQEEFRRRVKFAMADRAVAVYGEGSGVAGHAVRAAYATKVLAGNYNLESVCFAICTFATITNEAVYQDPPNNNGIPDNHITQAATALWNALSGV